ncbi:hypothetical protein PROFUN_15221 [Planoprotostelium fungivorum]|uniref:Uncharacterized protein n=1 Tax=Planoprotostelium fungivorum TaxID=1890364 RepID=A0A2P6MWU4_9EUKA|nr:hypothetical protein PROFUN_15221 [Planoprotostelium fungivorum]
MSDLSHDTKFKDYLDEISAKIVKKETGPDDLVFLVDARDRIKRRILQAAENTGDMQQFGKMSNILVCEQLFLSVNNSIFELKSTTVCQCWHMR